MPCVIPLNLLPFFGIVSGQGHIHGYRVDGKARQPRFIYVVSSAVSRMLHRTPGVFEQLDLWLECHGRIHAYTRGCLAMPAAGV